MATLLEEQTQRVTSILQLRQSLNLIDQQKCKRALAAFKAGNLDIIETAKRIDICHIWRRKQLAAKHITRMIAEVAAMEMHNDARGIDISLLSIRARFSETYRSIGSHAADIAVINHDVALATTELGQIAELVERPMFDMENASDKISDEDLLAEFMADITPVVHPVVAVAHRKATVTSATRQQYVCE